MTSRPLPLLLLLTSAGRFQLQQLLKPTAWQADGAAITFHIPIADYSNGSI